MPVGQRKPQAQKKYLDILETVFKVFKDKELVRMLTVLESAICTLDTFATTPQMSRTPSSAMSPRVKPENLYQNSGPKIRADIIHFEKTFRYRPIFCKESPKLAGSTLELV